MAGLVNEQEVLVLNHYLGGTQLAAPDATVHVALFTTNPSGDDEAGTGAVEAAYTGYGRVAVTNNGTNWPAAISGNPSIKSNANAITFGQKTDAGSVTITGFGIYNQASGGVLRMWAALGASKQIDQNDTPEFQAGQLQMKAGDPGDPF